jgi:hypothetical protein
LVHISQNGNLFPGQPGQWVHQRDLNLNLAEAFMVGMIYTDYSG